MSDLRLKHSCDAKTRAKNMIADVKSGKKLQHRMINAATDFLKLQDLYLNAVNEWFDHPKCQFALDSKGDKDE